MDALEVAMFLDELDGKDSPITASSCYLYSGNQPHKKRKELTMKKIKTSKLSLNAETIKTLTDHELRQAAGAWTNTCLGTACMCTETMGNGCATQGYTECLCTYNSACGRC